MSPAKVSECPPEILSVALFVPAAQTLRHESACVSEGGRKNIEAGRLGRDGWREDRMGAEQRGV